MFDWHIMLKIYYTIMKRSSEDKQEETEEEEEVEKAMIFLQYRGKLTEKFEHALKRIEA